MEKAVEKNEDIEVDEQEESHDEENLLQVRIHHHQNHISRSKNEKNQ